MEQVEQKLSFIAEIQNLGLDQKEAAQSIGIVAANAFGLNFPHQTVQDSINYSIRSELAKEPADAKVVKGLEVLLARPQEGIAREEIVRQDILELGLNPLQSAKVLKILTESMRSRGVDRRKVNDSLVNDLLRPELPERVKEALDLVKNHLNYSLPEAVIQPLVAEQ